MLVATLPLGGAGQKVKDYSDKTCVLDHTIPEARINPCTQANTFSSQSELHVLSPATNKRILINGFCLGPFSGHPASPQT